ncbi:MAG TPA: helix-turn-helix transcriptional regulator [Pseudonocardiaceae bacterium]|jgi:transcriptional regulator with XRE-family HTH domain|nr:helix-turn-helix transcriptional regulator [Pseudonocardiaceae bacterium]
MVRGHSPTVRRRRLAAELRRLRDQAQLTIEDVAEKLKCSSSKISRIETGHVGVSPKDARELLRLYGVPGDDLEALVQLAREARRKGWWHSYNEVFTGAFVGLEAEASSLRAYQALLIPGLLQTEDYMRAVIRAARPDATPPQVDKRVHARVARQRLLTEPDPPRYWAIVDEAVLCRSVGGDAVMRAQLEMLLGKAALPHVTIQVLPFSVGAHAGMEGSFLILGFPEQADPDVVYVDSTTAGIYLEEPAEILRYTLMFDHLRAAALSPDDSLTRIAEGMSRFSGN